MCTFELRWTSLTSLHLDLPLGMLSKSRTNFDKTTSKTLDLQTHYKSKAMETLAHKTQDKEKTTNPHHKQIRGMGIQRRKLRSGANFKISLGTTPMNVSQRSHWCPRSNLKNQILIQIQNPMSQV